MGLICNLYFQISTRILLFLGVSNPKRTQVTDVKDGDWVKVIYEGEWFLGKVVKIVGNSCLFRCLKKSI